MCSSDLFSGSVAAGFGYFQANSTLGHAGGDPEIQARLGNGVVGRARMINLAAASQDTIHADSVSAGLGVGGTVAVSIAGARSEANTFQTVRSAVGDGADLRASEGISLQATADQSNRDADGKGQIDSRAQGIAIAVGLSFGVAGGGAGTDNTLASEGQIQVGNNARVVAPQLNLAANNRLSKNKWGASDSKTGQTFGGDANTRSVAGSWVGVTINPSSTKIGSRESVDQSFGSSINLGDGALLQATGSGGSAGRLNLSSGNDIFATDLNILDAVSGFGLTVGGSLLSNDAQATITAGQGSRVVNTSGDVQLSTSSNATLSSSSSALSGFTGGGGSTAEANNRPQQSITLNGAQVEGDNIKL